MAADAVMESHQAMLHVIRSMKDTTREGFLETVYQILQQSKVSIITNVNSTIVYYNTIFLLQQYNEMLQMENKSLH